MRLSCLKGRTGAVSSSTEVKTHLAQEQEGKGVVSMPLSVGVVASGYRG